MSNNIVIKPENLSGAISEQLGLYQKDVQQKIDKHTKKAANELVRITKDTAPYNAKHHGRHYVDCIVSKKQTSKIGVSSYVWYVQAPCYRLTHLLISEHKTVLGTGKSRRKGGKAETRKSDFLKTATEKVNKELYENVERTLKDGS